MVSWAERVWYLTQICAEREKETREARVCRALGNRSLAESRALWKQSSEGLRGIKFSGSCRLAPEHEVTCSHEVQYSCLTGMPTQPLRPRGLAPTAMETAPGTARVRFHSPGPCVQKWRWGKNSSK